MRRHIFSLAAVTLAASPLTISPLAAQDRPTLEPDGSTNVPAFRLPPSELSSPEARAALAMRARMKLSAPVNDAPIEVVRQAMESSLSPLVTRMRQVYPVDVVSQAIAGVPTRIITPAGKPFDRKRVLINLHGGGFSMCADACALLESVPIASLGGYKVVTVNYRQGPEARHPAALEDVEAVYRELLKSYKPRHIGIYGCSAGGSLSAQMAAWLPKHGLPQPGGIGIFGAGGVRFWSGDSAWVTAYTDGTFPAPDKVQGDITRGYFDGADMKGDIISPAAHPDVAAKFPPTLIITGSRSMDMSPAIATNSLLLKAGVRSTLIVGEAMGHCYIYQPDLPEARDAHKVTVDFFKDVLR